MGNINYKNGFDLTLHEQALGLPFKWKNPQKIFVNSMSDLFHENIPDTFIFQVFEVMRHANWHQYQILTKRSERMLAMTSKLPWATNIWMGVTVETQNYAFRIDHLRNTGALVKFISFEPLLGQIRTLNLNNIDWAIVGGESGPKSRQIEESWVIDIRNQCEVSCVPFFFKQWGGTNKKKSGRELQGKIWNEMPALVTA